MPKRGNTSAKKSKATQERREQKKARKTGLPQSMAHGAGTPKGDRENGAVIRQAIREGFNVPEDLKPRLVDYQANVALGQDSKAASPAFRNLIFGQMLEQRNEMLKLRKEALALKRRELELKEGLTTKAHALLDTVVGKSDLAAGVIELLAEGEAGPGPGAKRDGAGPTVAVPLEGDGSGRLPAGPVAEKAQHAARHAC